MQVIYKIILKNGTELYPDTYKPVDDKVIDESNQYLVKFSGLSRNPETDYVLIANIVVRTEDISAVILKDHKELIEDKKYESEEY